MNLTYTSLVNYLLDLSARQNDENLKNNLPLIITFAQYDINSKLNVVPTEVVVTGEIDSHIIFFQKPIPNIRPVSFVLNDPTQDNKNIILEKRDYAYLQNYALSAEIVGEPKYYSDFNRDLYTFAPTPKVLDITNPILKYSYIFKYHVLFSPLDSVTQQNNLTVYYPHILMTAASYYMWQQLQTPLLANQAKQDYMEMINFANKQGIEAKGDTSTDSSKI